MAHPINDLHQSPFNVSPADDACKALGPGWHGNMQTHPYACSSAYCNIKYAECLCRLYIPDDIDYVEQDLEQLKGLFLADGQGLPAEDVDNLCAPVVDLLNVLQLETGILIKNFKDVSFFISHSYLSP